VTKRKKEGPVGEAIHVPRDALKPMPPPRPAFAAPPQRPEAPRASAPPRPQFTIRELVPMSIFSRARDIVAANLAELLDRAEDPARMIRLIVLETEETLAEARAGAARTRAEQAALRRRIAEMERLQARWAEKAERALAGGRDDLARAALVEKQQAAGAAEALTAEIAVLDEALEASEADLARLEAKLAETKARQHAIQARMDAADRQARLADLHARHSLDGAFSRFARLERRVDEAEARADPLALAAPPPTLEEEIAALGTADKVDAELAALKARLAGKGE
jgi:phage shock protein A